jgi:hypothetical protein
LKLGSTRGNIWKELVNIGKGSTVALLDSGASSNFISRSIVRRLMLDTVSRTPCKVTGIDGKPFQGKMGTISCETGKISIGLGPGLDGQHKFSVIETEKDILVLGMPWFENINPRID